MPEQPHGSWRDHYRSILADPQEAVRHVQSGQRIFMETNCAEPLSLIEAMMARRGKLEQVEIVQGFYRDKVCPYAQPGMEAHFRITAFHVGPAVMPALRAGFCDYIPVHLSEIPRLCEPSGPLPIDVALVQLSPPDDEGYCSFGIAVNFTKPIVENARCIVAEINDCMPYVFGDTTIHVSRLAAAVEVSRPLVELPPANINDEAKAIAEQIAPLIPHGATLQIGIGSVPDAVLALLRDHHDLGIHSGQIGDTVVEMIQAGVITNARKSFDKGVTVSCMAMGTNDGVYRFIHRNTAVAFHPVAYTHDPCIVGRIDNFITLASAVEIDLTGQVNAEMVRGEQISGLGGSQDYLRASSRSSGGKAILAMTSTAGRGKFSRIVPSLPHGVSVSSPRGDVHYVVTEYGIANLRGRTLGQRARALVEIAHPRFRDELRGAIMEMKLGC
ncbi:MAG: acetyl-CoA hydrolase/transferase family protein [Deltaproteobacteria bacterium]|nr:acetyl-CoA hydrolase/transferase family protein [Deltaproteobacteria bacterium]